MSSSAQSRCSHINVNIVLTETQDGSIEPFKYAEETLAPILDHIDELD